MPQPDPSAAAVALWLKTINREQLHEQGWITINKRFHGIVRAARPFLQATFPNQSDQEAAFDGLTMALLAVARFDDLERLSGLLVSEGASEVLADNAGLLTQQPQEAPQEEPRQLPETFES